MEIEDIFKAKQISQENSKEEKPQEIESIIKEAEEKAKKQKEEEEKRINDEIEKDL